LKGVAMQKIKPVAHFDLGVLLIDQGRVDEAIESYRKAIELKPDYAVT